MKRTLCFWKSTDTACRRERGTDQTGTSEPHSVLPVPVCLVSGHSGEMRGAGVVSPFPQVHPWMHRSVLHPPHSRNRMSHRGLSSAALVPLSLARTLCPEP